ncbi:MAG: bifunctional UDP-N-acetylglucosamine diphosphorylase/glucosamine-1-phosphate N-acetyltransferase GlmU [Pseudomonadota bacterium]
MQTEVIVLAAGRGTRMRSAQPKVLHRLAGRPLLGHVLEAARQLRPQRICVVAGAGLERVVAAFADDGIQWVEQAEQLGTAHAVQMALPGLDDQATALILYGDVPLIRPATLAGLLAAAQRGALAILTSRPADPTGYGRLLRDGRGRVLGVVEERDATPAQRAIGEVNTGILALPVSRLRAWLARVGNANAQGEYYLTDIVSLAVADGVEVATREVAEPLEAEGVNDRRQLARLERAYQMRLAERLMAEGVGLADPGRFDCRGELVAGCDVWIDVNCVFEGRVVLADGVQIGPHCVIRDAEIGAGAQIRAHTVIEGPVTIAAGAQIGPFARLREGSRIGPDARIGNFVETKQAELGAGSKANHLAYLGDARLGVGVNIGAGTITCNYDGADKHHTEIGDGAFIGSNSALVAPVRIGAQATVGAGSTITAEVPDGSLGVARSRQRNLPGWQRPRKPPAGP